MSSVQDLVRCHQCDFDEANYEFNCRTGEEWVACPHCGYHYENKYEDGKWAVKELEGNGVLSYTPARREDGIATAMRSLAEGGVPEAEQWLKEQLASGRIKEDAYLSRWNKESKSVDLIIGNFPKTGAEAV